MLPRKLVVLFEFIHHHYIAIIVLIVLTFLVLAGSAVLEAWIDFKGRPKEAMFWCHKHGFFRKKHCLELFPEIKDSGTICPECYRQEVFVKPNQQMKVN